MIPVAVFYDEAMIADNESYSPAASKPRNVVHAFRQQHLSIEIKGVPPCNPRRPLSRPSS